MQSLVAAKHPGLLDSHPRAADGRTKASFVNAMIEPRSADERAWRTHRAKALIEARDFDAADIAALYTDLARSAQATLTLAQSDQSGQRRRQGRRSARLEQARRPACRCRCLSRSRAQAPAAWATTRANLALVHMARYESAGNQDDLLSAHLALDGPTAPLRAAAGMTFARSAIWDLGDRRALAASRARVPRCAAARRRPSDR